MFLFQLSLALFYPRWRGKGGAHCDISLSLVKAFLLKIFKMLSCPPPLGFMVSLLSVLLGYLLFIRILGSVTGWYSKLTKS